MKLETILKLLAPGVIATGLQAEPIGLGYTNFIRQVQLPSSGVQRDVSVAPSGQQESPLEINPTGARFELHTVKTTPLQSFLLDTRYVGSYVPVSEIVIRTEDTKSNVPRTRADRPFEVDVMVGGLRDGAGDPEASKSVGLYRHTQSYDAGGNVETLDPTLATLESQASVRRNGTETLVYPGKTDTTYKGEERFSVFSVADFQAPASQLASQTVQIWPDARVTSTGLDENTTVGFTTPEVTFNVYDIYPDARVWAQVYPGPKRDNVEGVMVPGSWRPINSHKSEDRTITLSDWGSVLTSDGIWTMELLIATPFDVKRYYSAPFPVDKSIKVNGGITTFE